MQYELNDRVHILFEGKPLGFAESRVLKVGRKWLHVTFGDENVTRKFTLDGLSGNILGLGLDTRVTLQKF